MDENTKKHIRDLIKNGQTERALSDLEESFDVSSKKETKYKVYILLQAKFSNAKRNNMLGLISTEQYSVEVSKTNNHLIEYLDIDNASDTAKIYKDLVTELKKESNDKSTFLILSGILMTICIFLLIIDLTSKGKPDSGINLFFTWVGFASAILSLIRKESQRHIVIGFLIVYVLLFPSFIIRKHLYTKNKEKIEQRKQEAQKIEEQRRAKEWEKGRKKREAEKKTQEAEKKKKSEAAALEQKRRNNLIQIIQSNWVFKYKDWIVVSGLLKNTGRESITFYQVHVHFLDENMNYLDSEYDSFGTDLHPGESRSFRMYRYSELVEKCKDIELYIEDVRLVH